MKRRQLFPLGKAFGSAFCNRTEESKRLLSYIQNGTHTYLVAPRRYGKYSLCDHVFANMSIPSVKLDFHLAMTEKDAETLLLHGVTSLIGKSVGAIDQLQNSIMQFVKKLRPKFVLGTEQMKLELALEDNITPAESIVEALFLLEKLLQEKNQQAVLLLDEFQEIGLIEKGRSIEGAIRHVAQETQCLSIVFSGSNPHMLETMFEDKRRPLYKLCRKLILNRMEKHHYQPHLNAAANIRWNEDLDPDVFEKIMSITERHPYYVNYLCNELWLDNEKPPTVADVEEAWCEIVEEERSDLIKDFFSLPDNQRKILIYLSNHAGENLHAHEVITKIQIPSGSIGRAIAVLIEKNYIEKVDTNYRVIVPVYQRLLSKKLD
jgi:hypothetical protein